MFYDFEPINTKTKNEIDHPHRHNFFEVFILEGKGKHLIDFEEYLFEGYTIHVIAPKQVHLLNREIETKGFVLKFDQVYLANIIELDAFFKEIIFNSHFKPVQEISKESFETAIQLKEFLDRKNLHKLKHLSALAFLTSLFHKDETLNSTSSDEFDAFLSLLEKQYKDERTASVYADNLGVTLKQLNNIVKTRTGQSAKQFISERLILEAKRLLFHGKLTIKEIAYELNFNEPAHFSNFFKKEMGIYPNEFKK